MRQGSIHAFYNRQLHVDWNLTYMCNYRCSYCFGQNRDIDRRKFSAWNDLKAAVDHLAGLKRPTCKITLSGGESTIHPHFFQLIEYLAEKLQERLNYILIISNGSRQGKLYEKLAAMAKTVNLNMLCSLHTEHLDLNHILNLIEKISGDIRLTFNLMFNPAKRQFVKEIFEALCTARKTHAFNMNIALLRMPPKFDIIDSRYTPEDFAWREDALAKSAGACETSGLKAEQRNRLPETTFIEYERDGVRKYEVTPYAERDNLLKAGFFNFKGMQCLCGSSVFSINHDGKVKGTECAESFFKYNIYKENPFQRPDFTKFIKCGLENCGCSANDSIPKFRNMEEATGFLNSWR